MANPIVIIVIVIFALLVVGGIIGLLIWLSRRNKPTVQPPSPTQPTQPQPQTPVVVQLPLIEQLNYTDIRSLTYGVRAQMQKLATATVFPSDLIAPLQSYQSTMVNLANQIQTSGTPQQQADLQTIISVFTPTVAPLTAITNLIVQRNQNADQATALRNDLTTATTPEDQISIIREIANLNQNVNILDQEISTQLKRFFPADGSIPTGQ